MAYDVEEAKKLVVEAGKKLLETGLIARTWGNVSARISDTQFVITPSGRAYDTLTPEEVVVVILMTAHMKVILNHLLKRVFMQMLISIIRLLILLFIVTKRLLLLSALQVWKSEMYIMNLSRFSAIMYLLPNMLCQQQIHFVKMLKNV